MPICVLTLAEGMRDFTDQQQSLPEDPVLIQVYKRDH